MTAIPKRRESAKKARQKSSVCVQGVLCWLRRFRHQCSSGSGGRRKNASRSQARRTGQEGEEESILLIVKMQQSPRIWGVPMAEEVGASPASRRPHNNQHWMRGPLR